MASSRLPRFIMEVAPPQFVTVMRQRTRTMLDTINEEDNLDGSKSLSSTTIPAGATMATAATAASSSSATTVTAHSKYFSQRRWLLLDKPPSCLCTLPPLSLSGHLGALAGGLGCFPLNDEVYPPSSHRPTSTAVILSQLLRLNTFRGEPTSSVFEWRFTPNHNSSANSSTSVGSDLHLVSPKFHPGHG
ncbi:hypothetical protein Gogos_002801 [Gossypium gossypioides]|uniref:Uncharacterized protein n=2 Tax=Gossypium TaxID=3633 RepID=A0A7J9CK17_GOSGO|nr:hypothetical protein [Gossypium gossypioides]